MVKARELVGEEYSITAVLGEGDIEIASPDALSRLAAGKLSFCKASSLAEVRDLLDNDLAGAALICRPSLAAELDGLNRVALLISEHPRLSFSKVVARCFPPPPILPGIHPTAVIEGSALIDATASIGAFCVVGSRCAIGPRSVIHSNVVLERDVRIGRDVIIHSGTVIGADGFGYERDEDGSMQKFPHLGGVLIEDEVEIGSNTSIDRGSLGDTILRRRCKIDNLVHVAHNVVVEEDAVVIAQAMLGGGVYVGPRAWVAPAAVILNQVSIGADALVGLGAVVTKDVEANATVLGSPAVPEAEFRADRVARKRLLRDVE